ncbi:efflux transporter outer membrane subunit [Sphingomonas lenta]|uniref:efflux transporter outer membrane subunit n=1 Tax=Sphingomonas lenta TaxID=1141887 RepID=UPI0015950239|nr:efflux transporter outer membrane subunit [Sphingomonas lenta]
MTLGSEGRPALPRFILLTAFTLAACSTVERAPPASSAEAALPPSFALLDRERAGSGSLADLLPRQDPAFVELERRALTDAPTLLAALARIDAARAGVRGARAERFPNVQASGSVTRQRINPGAQFGGDLPPGVAIEPGQTQFRAGLDASFDADLFGRLRASERAARLRVDAADADAAGVRLALTGDIARTVVDARALDRREAVVRRDIASAEELVAVTRVRSRAGIAPEFDLVRAQSLEADARARLQPILSERAAVLGRLVTLTGLPTSEVQGQLAAPPGPGLTAVPALSVPSTLLRGRPDVAAAERRLAAADQEIAAAAADRFPRLTITAALGLFALTGGGLFSDDAIVGFVGPGLAGPLLDFGRVGARIDQRQAEAREAFANYRDALFTALGETEQALGQITAADARAVALERQAFLDRDAAGLARERYRRGLDTFLTVIDAERTANTSQANAIEARADASRTRVALYRAVGGEAGAKAAP